MRRPKPSRLRLGAGADCVRLGVTVFRKWRLAVPCVTALLLTAIAPTICHGATTSIKITRISHAPRLEAFENMSPSSAAAELQQITGFIQNQPSDGKPATERTDAYLGYDESNLYVVLVCFDSHHHVQANLTRREPSQPFDSDDYVEIVLDTFQDQRHAFIFDINPKGV